MLKSRAKVVELHITYIQNIKNIEKLSCSTLGTVKNNKHLFSIYKKNKNILKTLKFEAQLLISQLIQRLHKRLKKKCQSAKETY